LNNLDELMQDSPSDDDIVIFKYSTEYDVSLREYPEEPSIIVNKTDSLKVWWQLMSLECNQDNFLVYLDRGREFMEGKYYVPVSAEKLLQDEPEIYKAYKENPEDLFEILECETINVDSKSGVVRGTWEMDFVWGEVKSNPKFFQVIREAEGYIDLIRDTSPNPFR
jgi:hypothetical protein